MENVKLLYHSSLIDKRQMLSPISYKGVVVYASERNKMNEIIERLRYEYLNGLSSNLLSHETELVLREVEKMQAKIDELEHKVYCWKVQESLMRPLIDDNFKG